MPWAHLGHRLFLRTLSHDPVKEEQIQSPCHQGKEEERVLSEGLGHWVAKPWKQAYPEFVQALHLRLGSFQIPTQHSLPTIGLHQRPLELHVIVVLWSQLYPRLGIAGSNFVLQQMY